MEKGHGDRIREVRRCNPAAPRIAQSLTGLRASLTSGDTSLGATINAVALPRSMALIGNQGIIGAVETSASSSGANPGGYVTVELSDTTTILAKRGVPTSSTADPRWEVVEW